MTKVGQRPRSVIEPFVLLLAPFAPHLPRSSGPFLAAAKRVAAALARLRSGPDGERPADDPIQVNGKLRGKIEVGAESTGEQVEALPERKREWLQGKEPKKIIYVEKKLVNFVI